MAARDVRERRRGCFDSLRVATVAFYLFICFNLQTVYHRDARGKVFRLGTSISVANLETSVIVAGVRVGIKSPNIEFQCYLGLGPSAG